MNEFYKAYGGFLLSAAGISLGWILNQITHWFKARQEDKKNLKLVLFNLLETYYLLQRSDLEKAIAETIGVVMEQLPEGDRNEATKVFLKKLYSGLIIENIKPRLIEDFKVVQENYNKAVLALASTDPVLAYHLYRRTNILESYDSFEAFLDEYQVDVPINKHEFQIGVKHALKLIKPEGLTTTQKETEKDIRNVAWKISPYTWYKSKKAIIFQKKKADHYGKKEFAEVMDKLKSNLPQIIAERPTNPATNA